MLSEKVSVKEGLDVVTSASPIGKAILGKSEGETVLVKGTVAPISVTLIHIERERKGKIMASLIVDCDLYQLLALFEGRVNVKEKPELSERVGRLGRSLADTVEKIRIISAELGMEVYIGFLLQAEDNE